MAATKPITNRLMLAFFLIEFVFALIIFGPALSIIVSFHNRRDVGYGIYKRDMIGSVVGGAILFGVPWADITCYAAAGVSGLFLLWLLIYLGMFATKSLYSVGMVIAWSFFWVLAWLCVMVVSILVLVQWGSVFGELDGKVTCVIAFTFILFATHIAFIVIAFGVRRKAAEQEKAETQSAAPAAAIQIPPPPAHHGQNLPYYGHGHPVQPVQPQWAMNQQGAGVQQYPPQQVYQQQQEKQFGSTVVHTEKVGEYQ